MEIFEGKLQIDQKATTFENVRGSYGVNDNILNDRNLQDHAEFQEHNIKGLLIKFQRQFSTMKLIDRDVSAKYGSEEVFQEFGQFDGFYDDRLRDHFLPKLLHYIKTEGSGINNKRRTSGGVNASGGGQAGAAGSSRSTSSSSKKKGTTPATSLGPYLQVKHKTDDVAKYIAMDAETVVGNNTKQRTMLVKKQENKKLLVKKICDILITDETLEIIFKALTINGSAPNETVDASVTFKARTKAANSTLKQTVIASIIRNIPTLEVDAADDGEQKKNVEQREAEENDEDVNQEYKIEAIVSHRGTTKRNLSFQVKYVGYAKLEWNSYANLKETEQLHQYLRCNSMDKFIPDEFVDGGDDDNVSETNAIPANIGHPAATSNTKKRLLSNRQKADVDDEADIFDDEFDDEFDDDNAKATDNTAAATAAAAKAIMDSKKVVGKGNPRKRNLTEEEDEDEEDEDVIKNPNGQIMKKSKETHSLTVDGN
jgi:hypothetical protein